MKMQTYQSLYTTPRIVGRSKRAWWASVPQIFSWCRRAARHFTCVANHRSGFAQLSEMDDRMLRDIGLNRAEVHRLLGRPHTPWSEYRWLPFEFYR